MSADKQRLLASDELNHEDLCIGDHPSSYRAKAGKMIRRWLRPILVHLCILGLYTMYISMDFKLWKPFGNLSNYEAPYCTHKAGRHPPCSYHKLQDIAPARTALRYEATRPRINAWEGSSFAGPPTVSSDMAWHNLMESTSNQARSQVPIFIAYRDRRCWRSNLS